MKVSAKILLGLAPALSLWPLLPMPNEPIEPVPIPTGCLSGTFPTSGRQVPTMGRVLTSNERTNIVNVAADDAIDFLSTGSYIAAVERLQDANTAERVCIETNGATLGRYPGVSKSGGSNPNLDKAVIHADVVAGRAPGTTLAGLIAFRGALIDGLGECDAYRSVLEYTCAKLASVTSGSLEESDLCAQLFEAKQKLEERPENKDASSSNDCLPSIPSSCLTQANGVVNLRTGSDPVPEGVPAADIPVSAEYITYFSEKRSDSVGAAYDPVVYTAYTSSKSLQVLFRVNGSKPGRRVIPMRIFPLAIALDDRDRDNPVVYVAGVTPTGASSLRKVSFIDGPDNDYADYSIVTMSNPNFGYVSDMAFDLNGGSKLYILDHQNTRIVVYDTVNPPSGSLPVFADTNTHADMASMKTLVRDGERSPVTYAVLVNFPYQLTCVPPSPIGVLWDATGSGAATGSEFSTVSAIVE